MAENRIGIEVTAKQDPKGFTASIQQIEQLENRVVALTKDTTELRKAKVALESQLAPLNKRLAEGAVLSQEEGRQLVQLRLRQDELTNSLTRSIFSQRTAREEMRNLKFASNDARMEAQLLAAQFGVNLPRGMDMFVSRIPKAQELMSTLTRIAPWVALGAAVVSVLPYIEQVIDRITGIAPAVQAQVDLIKELNRGLVPLKTSAAAATKVTDLERQWRAVDARLSPLARLGNLNIRGDIAERDRLAAEIKAMGHEQNQLTIKENQAREKGSGGGLTDLEESEQRIAEARLERLTDMNLAEAKLRTENIKNARDAEIALAALESHSAEARLARLTDENEAELQISTKNQEQLKDVLAANLKDSMDLLKDSAADRTKLNEGVFQLEVQMRDQQMDLAKQQAEDQRRLIRDTARDWESMYDRVIGTARSAGDVLNNIWREMADAWKRQVFQMLAAWASGGKQSGGAASGGLFGNILGSVFGAGTGAGSSGGTFGSGPVNGDPRVLSFANSLGGTALTAPLIGGGITPATAGPTSAQQAGLPATTPMGNILSKMGLKNFGASQMAGLVAGASIFNLGWGHGSLRGALGGAAGGALMGAAIGSIIPGLGTAIGAGIGAIVGGIAGVFGGDKKKEHDAQIEAQGFASIRQLLEEYSRHRVDYASTFGGYQEIHQQMQGAFQRSQSRAHEQYWFNEYVRNLQGIEDERNRRRDFMSGYAVPEFASGGRVPAILHEGEFVMSRPAVQRLGADLLERMNSGGGSSGDDSQLDVNLVRATARAIAKILKTDPGALNEPLLMTINNGGKFSRLVRS